MSGVAGWMEVGTGVAIEVDDCPGATAATGVIVGVGSGAFRAALAGAVGVGRGCVGRVVPAGGDGQHDDCCEQKGDRPHVRVVR